MNKYTSSQLKEMAITCLDARDMGDVRYNVLITALSGIMGISFEDVEKRIEHLAKWEKE